VPPAASSGNAAIRLPKPALPLRTKLSTLAGLGTATLLGNDVEVTGLSAASERVGPGDLFAGVSGEHAHGARFAGRAVELGAVAVLTDPAGAAQVPAGVPLLVVTDVRAVLGRLAAAVYGEPSSRLAVVGITGTSGKTTTTYLVRAGLQAAGITSGLIGTVATLIDDESVDTGFTTPEAPDLQALLAVMAERAVSTVVMEVSSHALALGRADGVDFAVGAFTNLSQDHLDLHGDMESYFAAKSRLFDGRARSAIVMVDDDWGLRLAATARPAPITVSTVSTVSTVGTVCGNDGATWQARDISRADDGSTTFRAVGPGVDVVTGARIPGTYNVANALLALAILHQLDIPVELSAPAVASAAVPGRMERVDTGQPYLAVVDYSHKPAAVAGALRALRDLTAGRLLIVLGCGGDRDRVKRPIMGQVAADGADVVFVTDDNPRSEDPAEIRRAILAGIAPADLAGRVHEVPGRGAAIAAAVDCARPGDTVLVAGKGHEAGQEIAGVVYPFDDRVELRRAIEARR
jgi:UDP-N-acetylmuramoyl-L-alanyl-D-glutamate--2,6-diaminopimelate ligase